MILIHYYHNYVDKKNQHFVDKKSVEMFVGELKNPGRSIPRGTLGACLFTGLIYAVVAFLVSATCSR